MIIFPLRPPLIRHSNDGLLYGLEFPASFRRGGVHLSISGYDGNSRKTASIQISEVSLYSCASENPNMMAKAVGMSYSLSVEIWYILRPNTFRSLA